MDELKQLKQIPILTVAEALGLQVEAGTGHYRNIRGGPGGKIVAGIQKNLWNNNAGADGSVIDLVKHVKGCSLGHARKFLRDLCSSGTVEIPAAATAISATSFPTARSSLAVFDTAALRAAGRAQIDYLRARGIDEQIIVQAIEQGAVMGYPRGRYRNTAMIHRDQMDNVVGVEVRAPAWKQFAGSRGFFRFHTSCTVDALVVVEGGVKALAYAQLFPHYRALILGTGGTPSRGQLDMLAELLRIFPEAALIAAQDADTDASGDGQAEKVMNVAANLGRDVVRHSPVGTGAKDWPELLALRQAA